MVVESRERRGAGGGGGVTRPTAPAFSGEDSTEDAGVCDSKPIPDMDR